MISRRSRLKAAGHRPLPHSVSMSLRTALLGSLIFIVCPPATAPAALALFGSTVAIGEGGTFAFDLLATAQNEDAVVTGFAIPVQFVDSDTFSGDINDFTPDAALTSVFDFVGPIDETTFGFAAIAPGEGLTIAAGQTASLFSVELAVAGVPPALTEIGSLDGDSDFFEINGDGGVIIDDVVIGPGFRVVAIPEPGFSALAIAVLIGGACRRRRRAESSAGCSPPRLVERVRI